MKRFALVAGLVMAGSAQAFPAFFTGNDLAEYCRTDRSFVHGYVSGVFDAYSFVADTIPETQWMNFCLPVGVISTQLSDVACNSILLSPERRHLAGSYLVWDAIRQKFPCS